MDRTTIEKLFTYSMLYVTFPNANEAKKVTEKMIQLKMTTFVNIVPTIITMYRVKLDENEIDSEVMMIAKIKTKNTDAIMEFVTEAHPYDVPEIYTVPIINLNKRYDQHLKESLPDLTTTTTTTTTTTNAASSQNK